MFSIPVVVDSHLRLPDFFLEYGDLVERVCEDLTIENQAKLDAKRRKQWGWQDLPDCFMLYDLDGDNLILPRGYALRLKQMLRERGRRVQWVDRRRRRRGSQIRLRKTPDPRFVHQLRALDSMAKHQQGIYQAPTGAGKSVVGARYIARKSPQRAIVLVDNLTLMNQWIGELGNWLHPGGMIGQIGNSKWVEKRITVATLQTVWSALKRAGYDNMSSGQTELLGDSGMDAMDWFNSFDLVLLDECHHVTANTIQQIVGNFTAVDRIGVSATPDRLDDKFEIARAVLGEVFHEDSEEELRNLGVIVKPGVHVIDTPFKFAYWPNHEAQYDRSEREWRCENPTCTIDRAHGHKDNFQKLKDKLVVDQLRNSMIVSSVVGQIKTGDHHHAIISNEVRHLEAIEDMYHRILSKSHVEPPPLFILTGRVTGDKRKAMIEEIKASPSAVVFTTVAKEGLDIPMIDRIYLAWPDSNPKVTQQKIGRGTRSHAGKGETLIFDFLDVNVPKLKKMFRNRRYKCYDRLDLDVILNH